MIDSILQHPTLINHIRETCEDNGLSVEIDDKLLLDDCLDPEQIIILKPDSFYSSRNMLNPPPSVDCIVIVKCRDGSYKFFIIELRNCTGTDLIKTRIIEAKFKTITHDFFDVRFSEIFSQEKYKIKSVSTWLIANPFNTDNLCEEDYKRKIKGSVIEQYLYLKPLRILGKLVMITPFLPRLEKPYPKITPC